MNGPGLLLAGQIGKPHGLAGEVYVVRISDDPARFSPGARLVDAGGRILTVQTTRTHRNRTLVKFVGVDTRSDADTLRGALFVPSSDIRALDANEFWQHELVGCDVVLPTGAQVGRVTRVDHQVAQDLLVVDTATGERLIPAVKAIVVDVDLEARRVTIDPPEGLL